MCTGLVYNVSYRINKRRQVMKVYTPDVIQNAEKYMFDYGLATSLSLMQKAAEQIYLALSARLRPSDSIVILCGKGNNAGDGYELARILQKRHYKVVCISAFGNPPSTDAALECYERFVGDGGKVAKDPEISLQQISLADVIIDAIFGIGFKGRIPEESFAYKIIERANMSMGYRIAIDVPSGISSADGSVSNIAFNADRTITINSYKIGTFSYPAKDKCGVIEKVDIGISENILRRFENPCLIADDCYLAETLPKRKDNSHKGDYGKLACICGSKDMTGAAVLSAEAALRMGTGLVTVASEESVVRCLQNRLYEPTYKTTDFDDEESVKSLLKTVANYSAILVGCGLGKSKNKEKLLTTLVQNSDSQIIIDADGINLIAPHIDKLREAKKMPVITPHPLEFSRLTGLDTEFINNNRIKTALGFAKTYKCITVLKGAATVIASPDGRFAVNTTGNAGLAKAGSGDVLAGFISGLAANPHIDAFSAAVCGVYLHGKAADILKTEISESGFLPSELAKTAARLLP